MNLLRIRSKWGFYSLIEHNGKDYPWLTGDFGEEIVSYIKYYSHNYRYTAPISYSTNYHRTYCTYAVCDNYVDEAHKFVRVGIKQRCSVWGYILGSSTIQPYNNEEYE